MANNPLKREETVLTDPQVRGRTTLALARHPSRGGEMFAFAEAHLS